MKKKTKIILITITSIILLTIIFATVDFFRAKTDKKPIFAIDSDKITGTMNVAMRVIGDSNNYLGLGYKVVSCNHLNKTSYHFGLYNINKKVCNFTPVEEKQGFGIVDETDRCDEALELIYEDADYKYYFPCIKSDTVFIIFADGTKISVKEALTENTTDWGKLLTEKYPEKFHKEAKVVNQNEQNISCNINDFAMNIYSDKSEYKINEKIKILGTLKYLGKEKQIKIWHANEYITFSITDGKDFNVDPVVNLILISSTLEKDKLYHFDFQKSGGYDASGPQAAFWKKFYEEKDLLLPKGEYKITMNGNFAYSSDMQEKQDLKCSLKIKVI